MAALWLYSNYRHRSLLYAPSVELLNAFIQQAGLLIAGSCITMTGDSYCLTHCGKYVMARRIDKYTTPDEDCALRLSIKHIAPVNKGNVQCSILTMVDVNSLYDLLCPWRLEDRGGVAGGDVCVVIRLLFVAGCTYDG